MLARLRCVCRREARATVRSALRLAASNALLVVGLNVAPAPLPPLQISLRRSDAGAPALRRSEANTRLTKVSGGTDYEKKLESAQEAVGRSSDAGALGGKKKLDVGAATAATPRGPMALTPRVPVAETSATAIQKVVRRRQSTKALKLSDS